MIKRILRVICWPFALLYRMLQAIWRILRKWNAPQIVQFEDGTYAIRKGHWSYEFFDLESWSGHFWWGRDSSYFQHCKGTKEKCEQKLQEWDQKERKIQEKKLLHARDVGKVVK